MKEGTPLWHLINKELDQPDILVFVEVKADAKLNNKFTKLKGYGTYFVPPKITPENGISNGMRINFKLLSKEAWIITNKSDYLLTLEHRWYEVVIIAVYLVPENEYNHEIVKDNFQSLLSITMNYYQRHFHLIIIGDLNARLGKLVGDTKKNDRFNWMINYNNNYQFTILNSMPPNKGIVTWQRGNSKAILDYVLVPSHSQKQYQLKIIPTASISDHKLLHLNANIVPKRKLCNPKKIIIYAKWKFYIKNKNERNKKQYDLMLTQIGIQWNKYANNNHCISKPTVNDVTKIFKIAHRIIWQAAKDNKLCVIIPLTNKMYNQKCRDSNYINDKIIDLLNKEIDLIKSQSNLMKQINDYQSLLTNSILQHKIENISIQMNQIRKKIRMYQIEAINKHLELNYDKNDHNEIKRFYQILKGDSSFDFYGMNMNDTHTTLDKIQIMDKIQEIFGKLFRDPKYSDIVNRDSLLQNANTTN